MIGYLLPVLALSLAVLLLNHQALMTYVSQPESDSSPRLRRIVSSASKQKTQSKEKARLDFIVAGFPKCGTTTLLYAFLRHNETRIGESRHQ
jgi:hypothetical protein